MKVLILGGTGSISTSVARALQERGDEVAILSRGRNPVPPQYKAIQGDRNDAASLRRAADSWKGDVVIDFIGFSPEQAEILYSAFRGKVAQHIFISTAAVYEKPPRQLPIAETSPLGNPRWDYAVKKLAMERYYLERLAELPTTIVRPSHTLGEGRIPSPSFGHDFTVARRILEGRQVILPDDGQWLWTITASSDFAALFCGVTGDGRAIGEAFHITQDAALTWNALYWEIGLALGRQPEIVHIPTDFMVEREPNLIGPLKSDKACHSVFDNTKIKRFSPDVECAVSPRRLIREAAAWAQADPARQETNPRNDNLIDRLLREWAGSR